VTRPVISACSFSLAYSSFSSACYFLALAPLLPGTPSDYLGGFSLGGSTYGASVSATRLVTSACCLSSSFAFATAPFSSAYALSSPPESVLLSFIFSVSLSLFCFIYYADRKYSSSPLSSPRLQWYQLPLALTEDSADPELIVSFVN
jgi:hypothetical protein